MPFQVIKALLFVNTCIFFFFKGNIFKAKLGSFLSTFGRTLGMDILYLDNSLVDVDYH